MLITSAGANKLLKKLQDEKEHILLQEKQNYTYVLSDVEKSEDIPTYEFETTNKAIEEIDTKITKIKHAINVSNTTNKIKIKDNEYSIDMILVRMAQLNQRKNTLLNMRNIPLKTRLGARTLSNNAMVEYRYANFDVKAANDAYLKIDAEITEMQLALDKYNQTQEFEIDIQL